MNYQKHYDLLIYRGKSRVLEGYSEKHHIIPRCLGGDNSDENLVRLTPEEHYLAHQLLVKIYPDNHKLVYAANMMVVKRPGNKQYGWLRRKFSMAMSEKMTGRTKRNDPGMKASAEKKSGRTKETCPGLKSMSEKLKGRTKETCPGLKAMSEKKSGRTKETCPGLKSMSEKLKGRTKETCPYLKVRSEKRRILSDVQEQILFDMRESGIPGKEILNYFESLNILISYSLVSRIYNQVKREKTKMSSL